MELERFLSEYLREPLSFILFIYSKLVIWRFMHRASSYNMYINQQDAQNSCD